MVVHAPIIKATHPPKSTDPNYPRKRPGRKLDNYEPVLRLSDLGDEPCWEKYGSARMLCVLCSLQLGDARVTLSRYQIIPGTDHSSLLRTQAQLDLSGKELSMERLSHGFLSKTRLVLGRSFFPLFAIVVIAGTMLWGPWVSLAVTVLAVAAALRLI